MEHTEFQKKVLFASMMGWCQAGRNLAYLWQAGERELLYRRNHPDVKRCSLKKVIKSLEELQEKTEKRNENLKSWAESHGYRTYLK